MNFENTNNQVYLQGIVDSEPTLNHKVMDETFFSFNLAVSRLSTEKDIIPVTVPAKIMKDIKVGDKLALRGQFRSFNKYENGKSRLILSVFCREFCNWDEIANPNTIELNGFICKPPIFRSTPLMREICDVLLAVNRNFNKSDYIPCIAWGRNAQFASQLPVGTAIKLTGRIQSREYKKQIEGKDEVVTKQAYEVSISNLAAIQKENAL